MTWTWAGTLATALDQVRSTIGDTNTNDQLLTDEQINWRLGQVSQDVTSASVRCVLDVIAKLARDYDRSNVGMSASRSQQIQHYKDLLAELQREANLCEISVGGISTSERDAAKSDTETPYLEFSLGMDDNV